MKECLHTDKPTWGTKRARAIRRSQQEAPTRWDGTLSSSAPTATAALADGVDVPPQRLPFPG